MGVTGCEAAILVSMFMMRAMLAAIVTVAAMIVTVVLAPFRRHFFVPFVHGGTPSRGHR